MSDDMRKGEVFSQVDGNVFIDTLPASTTMVDRENTMLLLMTVLNAIRIEGDTEKMAIAAKVCMSHLGVARFR